ncbi:MAG: transcriptional regulator, LacI family [Eubacterium sp.]|nr:transcriptional regulator, LacI family [Eubacterium sp.]
MATIRDVAKMANVSTATVSRILNADKTYKVTNETRERVWQAVKTLNYVRNQVKESVNKVDIKNSTVSKVKIGCILCVTREKYTDPYFMSILSGVEAKLIENGYSLSVIRTINELQDPTILFNTLSESLTGLIVMETLSDEIYSQLKDKVEFIVGIDTKHQDIDNVCYDQFAAAEKAVQHLIDKGHRRIGFIGGTDGIDPIRKEQRYRGYLSVLEDNNIKEDFDIVKNCEWDSKMCYSKTIEILNVQDRPTAIFAASDLMAMIAVNAIYEQGLKVPDDIAVIGLSNIDMSKYSNPPLSTIDVPKTQMGEIAAEILITLIKGERSLPKKIILPTSLVVRNST